MKKLFTASVSSLDMIEITLISEGIEFSRQGTCFTVEEMPEYLYTFICENDSSVKDATKEITARTESKIVYHSQFDLLCSLFEMGVNIYAHGPAGTGKSQIAKQLADFLGLELYPDSTLFNLFDLTGFVDANGVFHETNFYKAFKYGGVHLLDELDGSPEDVPLKLNSAIANGWITFPNGEKVIMHKDYRCFATGNTVGTGATEEYVGRHAIDAATLDRFQPVFINYDKNVEMAIADNNDELVTFVEDFRKAVNACKINHLVTYRELSRLVKYEKKFPLEQAIAMALKADEHILGKSNMKHIYYKMDSSGNKYTQAFSNIALDYLC